MYMLMVSLRQAVSGKQVRFPCGKRRGKTTKGDYNHRCFERKNVTPKSPSPKGGQ